MHDTSNFSNNCFRQIISHLIQCITIPVDQKFTYIKLSVPRSTFRLSASLLDIMGKSKEISQDLRKTIVDLHKSGSSMEEISKRLKVPGSSVQTIVRKDKHHGTTHP